jgi:hypothetical protein
MKRWLVGVAFVSSIVMGSCSWLPGPMDPKCDEKTVRELPSPDGRRRAVEIHAICEGGFYHSTIEVDDGKDRATAMGASPSKYVQPPVWPKLKVEWKSARELWLSYPAGVDAQCISSPPGVAVHCVDASIVRQ